MHLMNFPVHQQPSTSHPWNQCTVGFYNDMQPSQFWPEEDMGVINCQWQRNTPKSSDTYSIVVLLSCFMPMCFHKWSFCPMILFLNFHTRGANWESAKFCCQAKNNVKSVSLLHNMWHMCCWFLPMKCSNFQEATPFLPNSIESHFRDRWTSFILFPAQVHVTLIYIFPMTEWKVKLSWDQTKKFKPL